MPRLGIVIASVREGRVGRPIADWLIERARQRARFALDVVDLSELDLPLFAERNHPRLRQYENDKQKAWSARTFHWLKACLIPVGNATTASSL